MPHIIDFDRLESDLFILQHSVYGSQRFCEKFDLHSECVGKDYEWWEYKGILKTHVSNKIIEAAIKLRIIQDLLKHSNGDLDLVEIDLESRKGLSIGEIKGSSTPLSVRESCNKIVHAIEASMIWVNSTKEPEVEYWSGGYELLGENRGSNWQVELNISEWCTSMIRFSKNLQDSVDWYHVYKNDL